MGLLRCPYCTVEMRRQVALDGFECPSCVFAIAAVKVESWRRSFSGLEDGPAGRQALSYLGTPRYDAYDFNPQPDIDPATHRPRMRSPSPLNMISKVAKQIAEACVAHSDRPHPTMQLFDAQLFDDKRPKPIHYACRVGTCACHRAERHLYAMLSESFSSYDAWFAAEGTHRLRAAARLGLAPVMVPVRWRRGRAALERARFAAIQRGHSFDRVEVGS